MACIQLWETTGRNKIVGPTVHDVSWLVIEMPFYRIPFSQTYTHVWYLYVCLCVWIIVFLVGMCHTHLPSEHIILWWGETVRTGMRVSSHTQHEFSKCFITHWIWKMIQNPNFIEMISKYKYCLHNIIIDTALIQGVVSISNLWQGLLFIQQHNIYCPESHRPYNSHLICVVGNQTIMCPQGEVGLPGAPGLDGEKVILLILLIQNDY